MNGNSDSDADAGATLEDTTDGAADSGNTLETQLPGIEVTTRLADADIETLEAVHRRQLDWALDHAEEAKKATRL